MYKNKRLTVYDDDFVGGIDIQGTPVQGEGDRVIIQCRVGSRIVLEVWCSTKLKTKEAGVRMTHSLDRSFGQPRHQLLDITDTLSARDGRPESRSVPEL